MIITPLEEAFRANFKYLELSSTSSAFLAFK
jgi:hypothetical protein